MIVGYKPNGYFATATGEGKKVEGETRQCAHCEYSWMYEPGSGRKRGICLHCMALICGRAECFRLQKQMLETYPQYFCMNYKDYINRELERFAREQGLELLPSGILVPKGVRVHQAVAQPTLPQTMAVSDPQTKATGGGWNF